MGNGNMYTIIIGCDGSVASSVVEAITQNSNFAHTIRILAPQQYCGYNTMDFSAVFEYCTANGVVGAENLTPSEHLYKDFIEYILPVKISMTKESGVLKFCITFLKSIKEGNNQYTDVVLKTQQAELAVSYTDGWTGDLPDDTLGAIDEKLSELGQMQCELKEMQENLNAGKADNIIYQNKELQLTANGEPIGDKVKIEGGDGSIKWVEV